MCVRVCIYSSSTTTTEHVQVLGFVTKLLTLVGRQIYAAGQILTPSLKLHLNKIQLVKYTPTQADKWALKGRP